MTIIAISCARGNKKQESKNTGINVSDPRLFVLVSIKLDEV